MYQIIQHAGNAGMWTKELKQRSNLPVPQITKIFKTLEARKLIKSVKHVAQQNRKVYMLYDLEPSREITGARGTPNKNTTLSSSAFFASSASSSFAQRIA